MNMKVFAYIRNKKVIKVFRQPRFKGPFLKLWVHINILQIMDKNRPPKIMVNILIGIENMAPG